MWHEAGCVPVCKTYIGCDIEKEANDEDLERTFLQYQYAKILGQQGNHSAETKILEKIGLLDDPLALIEIENIYLSYLKLKRDKDNLKIGNGRQGNKNSRSR